MSKYFMTLAGQSEKVELTKGEFNAIKRERKERRDDAIIEGGMKLILELVALGDTYSSGVMTRKIAESIIATYTDGGKIIVDGIAYEVIIPSGALTGVRKQSRLKVRKIVPVAPVAPVRIVKGHRVEQLQRPDRKPLTHAFDIEMCLNMSGCELLFGSTHEYTIVVNTEMMESWLTLNTTTDENGNYLYNDIGTAMLVLEPVQYNLTATKFLVYLKNLK